MQCLQLWCPCAGDCDGDVPLGDTQIQSLASREQHHDCDGDMLDKRPSSTTSEEKEIAALVEVAFACLQTSPQLRPEMEDVYQKLALHRPPSSFASPSHAHRQEEIIEV